MNEARFNQVCSKKRKYNNNGEKGLESCGTKQSTVQPFPFTLCCYSSPNLLSGF